MGIERAARAWAHQHGLQGWRPVVAAYRGWSRVRYRRAWDRDVSFRGHKFLIGRDLTLFPAVRNGGFEAEELDALLPRVPDDALVWDVGANIGIYTVLLASAARNGRVIAFEPVPDSHARLLANVDKNGLTNVAVHRVALSDGAGTVSMAVHAEAHGCDQIGPAGDDEESIEVVTTTGDDFAARAGLGDPDVVKVDIEGHEPEFLAGAWETISRSRPLLLMEVNPAAWRTEERTITWQRTLDRLFELYGGGEWFDAGVRERVTHVDAAALELRAFTLMLSR